MAVRKKVVKFFFAGALQKRERNLHLPSLIATAVMVKDVIILDSSVG